MKRIILSLIMFLSVFALFADEELNSYKEKEDRFNVKHSFFFRTYIVNNTEKSLNLEISKNNCGYGEFKINKGNFSSSPNQIEEAQFVWRKDWPVQKELYFPVLLINDIHPDFEQAIGETKINPLKNRTANDAVEIVFHKNQVNYNNLNMSVRFEIAGNSDTLFVIIDKTDRYNNVKFI